MTPRGSPWVVIGAFVLIGPPVGGIVFGLIPIFESGGGASAFQDLRSLLGIVLMSYVFGAMPALLSGAVAAAISSRVGSNILWVAAATMTGAATSPLFFGGYPHPFAPQMAIIGGIAALVSAVVGLYVRPRWTNRNLPS